jgi:hypothetical protein
VLEHRWPGRGRYGIARADAWVVPLWDGADDVPGIDARSANFARLLAPLEV